MGTRYAGDNRHEASQGTATVGVSAVSAGTGGSVQGTTSAPNTRLGKKPPKRSTKRVRQVHVLVERAPCHFRMQARQEAVRSLCVAVQKEGEARAACLPGTGGEQRRDRRPVPCGLSLEGPAGLRGLNRKGSCKRQRQCERASLRIAANGPALTRVDDRATQLVDALRPGRGPVARGMSIRSSSGWRCPLAEVQLLV